MSRERSLWAWGWADRFPDDDARRGLAAQVAGLLGVEPPALRAPPTLATIRMPASNVTPPPELAGSVSVDRRERAMHAHGKAFPDLVRAFEGDFGAAPDAVAFPRDEDDIARVLAWCENERLAAVPFGGGTSVVGGVARPEGQAFAGAVAIDLRAMDRVLEVDAASRAARIQGGATGPGLEEQLAAHGLTLRHYPQSFEHSTLGGWIVTRAGGHFATLYTHVDDLVESVRMITPRGPFATRRLPASGAGPAPDRLVLGSEGTLGVVTEAWMRVRPRPRFRASASVRFEDFVQGARAARAVAQSGLYPSNCRLLDPHEALLHGVPADGGAVLLLGFESADQSMRAWIDRALAIAVAQGGSSAGAKEKVDERGADASAEAWRRAFFDAPYLQSALVSLGIVADTFETACTWDRFEELDARVRADVHAAMKETCGGGVVSCRFTHVYPDGPAPYFTFVCAPRGGGQLDAWGTIKRAAGDALAACGATITHHHAVGRTHRPWYEREVPSLFVEALRAAKRTMDPAGILNPGVLFD
ncbi:MAG TPA: FAD-binding oxidoreductase [Polyangiaceae bacterium]|jgi:alkyldihydroxyacetonephosphate synthase